MNKRTWTGLKNQNGDFRTIVAKRVVPKELPSKANLQLWEDFLASVRREVNFYKDMSKFNPELFPKVLFHQVIYFYLSAYVVSIV